MVNFYLAGLRAVRSFHAAQFDFVRAMERISTGQRINRAADDPAGLAISEKCGPKSAVLNKRRAMPKTALVF